MSEKPRVVAVIPARMGASRFPGKPLASIAGLPMIEHVRRRVALSDVVDEVIVATCDQVVIDTVVDAGGVAVMTADTHERCTDRVEEASHDLEADIVAIVQGDEPLFDPAVLDMLVAPMLADESVACTNLVSVISDVSDLDDEDIVKAVLDREGRIMYFSRAPIPFMRVPGAPMYRQTGISAFRVDFLHEFSALEPTPLEVSESVDFLRILEHGRTITAVVYDRQTLGVDREDDIAPVEAVLRDDPAQRAIHERIVTL